MQEPEYLEHQKMVLDNCSFLNRNKQNWALFEKYVIRRMASQNEKS